MTTIAETAGGLQPEASLSLAEFAPKSKWEGWFRAVILKDYTTQSGHVFRTEDVPTRDTAKTSRNLRVVAKVTNKAGDERTVNGQFNYEPGDLTAQRVSQVKQAEAEAQAQFNAAKKAYAATNNGSTRGFPRKFNEFVPAGVTRTRIMYQRMGAIEAAIKGFSPSVNGTGGMNVTPLIGEGVDVRLAIDDNGYPQIEEISVFKSHKETR